jgi:hypothetical protein
LDTTAPFGILALADFPKGRNDNLCLICENQDETRSIQIEVKRLACDEKTEKCDKKSTFADKNSKGLCSDNLSQVKNPKPIMMQYNPTS